MVRSFAADVHLRDQCSSPWESFGQDDSSVLCVNAVLASPTQPSDLSYQFTWNEFNQLFIKFAGNTLVFFTMLLA